MQVFCPATPRWAENRLNLQHTEWREGVPPEPDYSPLDASPWLHGPGAERGPLPIEDQPADEESPVCIPLDLQEFAQCLTKEELHEVRSPDQRLLEIEVPDILWHKAVARKKSMKGPRKSHAPGQKWRAPSFKRKLQERWCQQRKVLGDAYKDHLIPQRSKPKGARMAEAMRARLASARPAESAAGKKSHTPGPGRPLQTGHGASHAMQEQPGHPALLTQVLVSSMQAGPQHFGLRGQVEKVHKDPATQELSYWLLADSAQGKLQPFHVKALRNSVGTVVGPY